MRYTWTTKQFLPIGEKLGEKGISAARAESISAARFLPGGQKRANTEKNRDKNRFIFQYFPGPMTKFQYIQLQGLEI